MRVFIVLMLGCFASAVSKADTFILPTPNRALVTDGAASEKFLVGPFPNGAGE